MFFPQEEEGPTLKRAHTASHTVPHNFDFQRQQNGTPSYLKQTLSSCIWPHRSNASGISNGSTSRVNADQSSRAASSLEVQSSYISSQSATRATSDQALTSVPMPAATSRDDMIKSLSQNQAMIRTLLHAALKEAKQPETLASATRQIRTLMQQAALLHQLKTFAAAASSAADQAAPAAGAVEAPPESLTRSRSVVSESCSAPGVDPGVEGSRMRSVVLQRAPLGDVSHDASAPAQPPLVQAYSRSLASSMTAEHCSTSVESAALSGDQTEASSDEASLICHESIAGCTQTQCLRSLDSQSLRLWGSPTARLQAWSKGWERHAEWWRSQKN